MTQAELLQFATDIEDDDMTAIIGEQGEATTVTGTVLNSENGQPIVGAEVTLSDEVGNTTTVLTDAQGHYSVSGSVFEQGTITIEQEGAITNSFLVPAGETTDSGVISLSDVLETTDMRIVVTWGASPRDMDNHLWLYDTDTGAELDHIFYGDMNHDLSGGTVQQDVDDTSGHGPETITVPNYQDANMHYSVHNFTSRSWDVDGVDEVQVQVFVGDTLVQTFTPELPENISGDHWHVFDVVDGIVLPSQEVGGQTAFTLPTSEEVANAENGIDISALFNVDEGTDGENGTDTGDNVTVGDISMPNGVITDNGDGTYTITPDENFNGEFEINYTVDDGNGGVSPAQIDVTVTAVNDAAVIYDQVFNMDEDGTLTFTDAELLAGATDIEGDTLTVTGVHYDETNGVLTSNGDGTHTFTPNENFNGTVNFSFDVSDGTDISSGSIDVAVAAVNDAPVVSGSLSYTIDEDGAITLTQEQLLVHASDVDGDILTAAIESASNATVTENENGSFTLTPDENFSGEIVFSMNVSDGQSIVNSDVVLAVDAVSDAPDVSIGSTLFAIDTFETGMEGWSGATVADSSGFETGQMLGQQNNRSGEEEVSKTYDVPAGASEVTIEFDFYRLDSWDDHNFNIYIDGELFSVETFSYHGNDSANVVDINGQVVGQFVSSENAQIHGVQWPVNPHYSTDQSHHFTLTVPVDPDAGQLTLGFGSTLDQSLSDESWGLDNVALSVTSYPEDSAVPLDIQAALTDTDGSESLAISIRELPEGTLLSSGSLNPDGTWSLSPDDLTGLTLTPPANFHGELNLQVDAISTESTGDHSTTTVPVSLNITPVNDRPEAQDLQFAMLEDGSLTFYNSDLLASATDVDGDDLVVMNVDYSGNQGTLTDNQDGSYTFVPSDNYHGDVEFTFAVSDGELETTQSIAVNIEAVADSPELSVTDGANQPIGAEGIKVDPDDTIELNISAALTDIDGSEVLTVGASGIPEGSVIRYDSDTVLNDQSNGLTSYVDSEITVTFEGEGAGYLNTVGYYKVDENGQIQDVQVVYENASQLGGGGNLIPGQSAFSFDLEQGESFNLFVIPNGFNHNNFNSLGDGSFEFRDADGSTATTSSTDPQLIFVSSNGEETLIRSESGDAVFHGGTSPNLNQDNINHTQTYFNSESELVYGIEDMYNGGDRDFDDFLFTIDLGEVNSSIYQGEVTVDTTDPIILPTVVLLEPITIDLPEDYSGEFDLQIDATSTELSNEGTSTNSQTIHIDAREHAPESTPINTSVDEDGNLLVTQDMLLANAVDLNDDPLTASDVATNDPNAIVTDNGNGTFTIVPSENFNGDIELTYNISDGEFTTANTLNLTVNAVNDAPTSERVDLSGVEDESIIISQQDLLVHAVDIENDDLTANNLQIDPSFGDLVDNQNGTWTFTPTENLNGDVPFTFRVEDGVDGTEVSGNISLAEVNDAPDAPTVTYSTDEDQVLVVDPAFILSQASDIDNDALSLESLTVRTPENATLQQQPDGLYHLVTSQDFNGLVELDYIVSDGELSAQGTVNVDVIPVNDEPFTVGNAFLTTNEDDAFTFDTSDMLDLFGDIDTTELVISRVIVADSEDGGSVTDNGDGTWTFTPTSDFAGLSELQVIASDGEFETALDVPVYVRPVADGAVITTAHDGPLVFDEDTTGYLNLDVNLIDDSEQLSNLVMTGYPVGFTLSDGPNVVEITEEGQLINITNWDIDNLQMTPPEDFHGNFFVTVTATTVDYGDEANEQPEQPVGGDFNVVSGEALVISHEDLIAMAQNVEAEQGDSVQLVHLVDPSQGSLIENDDGTWTFSPASGFSGNVDLAYVIEKEGILYDEQSDIGVFDSSESLTSSPIIDAIAYTDTDESEPLTFTNEDMLATISSEDNHDLSIESVSLLAGEGLIESNGQGNYQFTPAEGFTGQAQVGFVASDGENSVQSHFNIGVDNEVSVNQTLAQADDGSIEISASNVLTNLSIEDSTLTDLNYTGDQGALISNGNDMWTFWPDDGFEGNIDLSAVVESSAGIEQTYTTSLTVETEGAQTQPVDTQSTNLNDEVSSNIESSVDITAAPGDEVEISSPEEVTSVDGVDYITVTNLPEGAEINGALSDGEGGYTISGDLSQSVTLVLDDQYEGSANLSFQGFDDLDAPVEGATATLELDIDEQYSMQASSQQNQDTSSLQQTDGADWTQSDNTQVDVDFTDDTGSFGTDDSSGPSTQSDVDDNLV
ncbi:tandem-95 repeat protein [Vibrio cionasavignyae]